MKLIAWILVSGLFVLAGLLFGSHKWIWGAVLCNGAALIVIHRFTKHKPNQERNK